MGLAESSESGRFLTIDNDSGRANKMHLPLHYMYQYNCSKVCLVNIGTHDFLRAITSNILNKNKDTFSKSQVAL